MERELPDLPQFNLPFAYRLQGPLNIAALERSLAEVVRRHETLRTGFAWVDERPVALVSPPGEVGSFFVVEDLAARAPTQNSRAKALLIKMAELRAEQEAGTVRHPACRRCSVPGCCDSALTTTSSCWSCIISLSTDGRSAFSWRRYHELYSSFAGRSAMGRCSSLRISFRTSRAGSGSGARARQQAGSSPIGKSTCEQLLPYFRPRVSLEAQSCTSHIDHEAIHLSKVGRRSLERLESQQWSNPVHDFAGSPQGAASGQGRTQ